MLRNNNPRNIVKVTFLWLLLCNRTVKKRIVKGIIKIVIDKIFTLFTKITNAEYATKKSTVAINVFLLK